MYASSSPPSLLFHSRRLLLLHNNSPSPSSSPNTTSTDSSYLGDGLNSIIRCALRCSNFVINDNNSPNPNNPNPRVANTGVKKKALKTFPTLAFSPELLAKLQPGLDSECAICLSDFNAGDRLRILPKCNHGFHVRCIDKWLSSHSSCPKCRHCLIETCNKIAMISPLEPEGLIRNYRGI
ncbi:RING-H2 finger protein ATL78 [Senna tora]|uniref:RING-type E3 ubiquitin transferase n=1 Tax=Senna tora TaxID=362788 RepID=A0A835CFY0_9FABA|nr:RING-H2 finger protein ATL78 [Senna tora]